LKKFVNVQYFVLIAILNYTKKWSKVSKTSDLISEKKEKIPEPLSEVGVNPEWLSLKCRGINSLCRADNQRYL
jgi:hypothetical protein